MIEAQPAFAVLNRIHEARIDIVQLLGGEEVDVLFHLSAPCNSICDWPLDRAICYNADRFVSLQALFICTWSFYRWRSMPKRCTPRPHAVTP